MCVPLVTRHTSKRYPVLTTRLLACFRQCTPLQQGYDPSVLALQRFWQWGYINFVLNIIPHPYREIWRRGGPWLNMNITQTSATYPTMWQFSIENDVDNCAPVRWSSILLKDEIREVSKSVFAINTTSTYSGTWNLSLFARRGKVTRQRSGMWHRRHSLLENLFPIPQWNATTHTLTL